MTYARARLWLGICGVGTVVTLAAIILLLGEPQRFLPNSSDWSTADLWALIGFVAGLAVLMLPFDFIGGYVLPQLFGRRTPELPRFVWRWFVGVSVQSLLFVLTGLMVLACGRLAGRPGATVAVAFVALGFIAFQGMLVRLFTGGSRLADPEQIECLLRQLHEWGYRRISIAVVDHDDPGFTGGVVGTPGCESLVVPRKWFNKLTNEELAVCLARRMEAVASGSRNRGLFVAFLWVLIGFVIGSLLPTAGVRSVAELVSTCCGVTCWNFLGLLVLPTLSRQASYMMDRRIVERGIPKRVLDDAIATLDRMQDDEQQRPAFVEWIFHPVPSVNNRRAYAGDGTVGAWHVARTALFLSWSCLGILSRAVHCNAGRPELWVMLPTD